LAQIISVGEHGFRRRLAEDQANHRRGPFRNANILDRLREAARPLPRLDPKRVIGVFGVKLARLAEIGQRLTTIDGVELRDATEKRK
jgi:hypothetical protein